MSRKHSLMAGCAILAAVITAAPAFAQDAPQGAESATADNAIIVTARRKAESTLDVPIAVSAISGNALAAKGVTQVDDLKNAVPSVGFRPTAGRRSNSQYEIRGIQATESLMTGDAPVGVYVDEVFRGRATGTNQSFFDIDNVQILYGPQGTLFGRNSASGAVLINSKRPVHKFEGALNVGYGNLNRLEASGMVNVPLGDTLAVRLAGQRTTRDGMGTNVTTGRKLADVNNYGLRGSILWEPTSAIKNTLIGSFYKANELGSLGFLMGYRPCPSPVATAPGASCSTRSMPDVPVVDTRTIGQALAQAVAAQRSLNPWQTQLDPTVKDFGGVPLTGNPNLSPDLFERTRNVAVTNITEFQITDDILIKNIFGYNDSRLIAATDLDGTPIELLDTYYDTRSKTYSDELQIQGKSGRLDWTVGGMYFRERGNDLQYSTSSVYSDGRTDVVGINKSYAVFAQGTYKITDQLSLTAGGRYTWDKRYVKYVTPIAYTLAVDTLVRSPTFTCNLSPLLDTDGDCIYEANVSFKQPTYTVSIDYKPTRDLLFYVAHRSGYRSGGLQARTIPVATGPAVNGVIPIGNFPPFGPEKVKDVELGFKGDIALGGEASLNTSIAVYQAWYTEVQRQLTVVTGLSSTTNPPGALTGTGIFNVGKATVKGLSVEGTLTLVRGFVIGGFFGLVDGKYTSYRAAAAVLSNVPFATSKYTAGVNLALTPIDSPETGSVTLSGSWNYRSRFTVDNSLPALEPESYSNAQHNVNLSLDWRDIMGSNFSAQAWVRNATNEANILGITALSGSFGMTPGVMGEPRTYGVNVGYKF